MKSLWVSRSGFCNTLEIILQTTDLERVRYLVQSTVREELNPRVAHIY
jgi:hypothetical protein